MAASPHDSLVSLLDVNPQLISKLTAADQQKLLDLINQARHTQNTDYSTATDKALQHAPALLRSTMRKIITG